jgi:hypothetical protein
MEVLMDILSRLPGAFRSFPLAALGAALLSLAGCSGMADRYEREVRAELAKPAPADPGILTDSAIARLPAPVRRYFRFAGYVGRPSPRNARVTWGDFRLKRGRDKAWMPLSCRQFNSVAEPMRIAYMSGRLFGVMPFEGRDKFQDGHGHMLIKAGGLFTVVDEKSRKLDESGLVTVLAEALLVPAYALQPYMRWEELDSLRARATLNWNGITASGIFHFAPTGESTRFETRVRWQQGADSLPIPWSGYSTDYAERDGIRFPRGMRAVWHERGGDFEYVQGRIERIEFDVEEP